MPFLNDLRTLATLLNPLEKAGLLTLVAVPPVILTLALEGIGRLDARCGLSERLLRWAGKKSVK